MTILSNLVVGLVAILHLYFLTLEMFLWTKPSGRRTFGLTPEFAEASKNLAANLPSIHCLDPAHSLGTRI